jgi:hypothetical protein
MILIAKLGINDTGKNNTQHNDTQHNVQLRVTFLVAFVFIPTCR